MAKPKERKRKKKKFAGCPRALGQMLFSIVKTKPRLPRPKPFPFSSAIPARRGFRRSHSRARGSSEAEQDNCSSLQGPRSLAGEVAHRPVSTAARLCRPGPRLPARSPARPPASDPAHTHHVREGGGGRSRGVSAVLKVRVVARRGSCEGSGASVGRECGARRRAAELIRAGPRNDTGAVCGARVERQRGGRLVQVALRVGHGHTRAWGAPRRGGQRAGRRPARASERAPGLWLPRAAALRAPAPGLRPAAPPGWLPARLRLRPPRPLLCAPRLPGLGFLSPHPPPSLFAPGGSAFGFAKVLPRC